MNPLLNTILAATLAGPAQLTFQPEADRTVVPEVDHYSAFVTIDTTGLLHDDFGLEDVERQQDIFERDLPSLFLEVGLADARAKDTAEVRVLFRWDDFDEFRYGVTFEVTTPDGDQHEHSLVFQGDGHDLLEHLKGEIPAVIALLERPPEHEDADPLPPTPSGPKTPPETTPKPEGRALLWTGVGLSILGAALVPTGVVLHMQTDEDRNNFESTKTGRRHPLPLTAGLMGLGGVALGAGVALIVVGVKKGKQSKKRALLVPSASPSHVGLTLQGRF